MNISSELEHAKMRCKRTELDIVHLRNIIAKMRSYDADEFAMAMNLIKKLRERMEVLENKVNHIEQSLSS